MEVNEALSIQQRIKRANIAHRNANKLKVARDRSARKLAPESNIKSRAYAVARKILRKRIAGGRGAVYQELGPTEKISIDKQLDKKKALIKKIALRLIPRIRQSEQHRLQSFLKGKAMKNDAINEAFEKKFKKTKKKPDSYIKFFNKFTEEKQNNTGAYKSLIKKSEKHGVDVEAIGDIYNEAFNDFENVETNLTPEQYAFSRVNHELNELSKQTLGSYINKSKADLENKEKADSYARGHGRLASDVRYVTKAQLRMANRKQGQLNATDRLLQREENFDESKNTPYVKPYEQNGQHVGWKASNKHGKLKFFGKQFKSSANKHAGIDEQTAYSQSELGKHVKTYKNVRGSKYDLYKNLNCHKLVNRISGASEDFSNHHVTRELHRKLLKTMLPEETQLDELSKSTLKSYLDKKKSGGKDYKTPLAFRKSMESNDIAASKINKPGRKARGTDRRLERTPVKIKATNEDVQLDELSMRTMGSYNEKARSQLSSLAKAAAERLANKSTDYKTAATTGKISRKRYEGLNRLGRKVTPLSVKEDLDEGRYIVSGTHEDQGFSKTKVYKADSEEHARKQFNDEFEKFNARKIKKLTLNKMKNEEHTNCGTPECCGQCEPLNEFVVTAAAIAGVAAMRKAKKVAPKVGNHIKNQAFNQAGHLKDKVASLVAKKDEKPEIRMSSKEYLKKREAELKEETDLTARIENLVERNKENKFKKDLYVAKKGQKASRIWGLNKSDVADRAGHDHHIDYGDNDDHNDDASARHGMRKTAVRLYKKLGRRGLKEDSVNEVLGPENQIGTKALVKKLQKLTPGQEKAQVNEEAKTELVHHGVILHRTNTERLNARGGYTSDHKVIKWSKERPINPNLKSFSGQGAGHAHQLAHQKAVRDHPEVKKHVKDGWRVLTYQVGVSKKPIIDHINDKLAYIKKQNGSLHLVEELDLDEACWKGYKQLGMKKKGKRTVPNCVKEDVKSAQLKGVIVPSYVDANGNTIPAKTVKRKEGNKILKTGNMQDGK